MSLRVDPRRRQYWAIAAAACLLITGVIATLLLSSRPVTTPITPAVATLFSADNAAWEGPNAPEVGGAMAATPLRLTQGFVQVQFASGAMLRIWGPASFKIENAGEAFLDAGRLRADVPAEARGFSVRTPALTVVDLGTIFGVDLSDSNGNTVHVIKGTVEISRNGTATEQLHAGEASPSTARELRVISTLNPGSLDNHVAARSSRRRVVRGRTSWGPADFNPHFRRARAAAFRGGAAGARDVHWQNGPVEFLLSQIDADEAPAGGSCGRGWRRR